MIADDEPNIRRVLQAIFQKDGYEVYVAENGVRALEVAASCPVDVLITDLIMPDMNGVELLKKIKQRHTGVVAVMITAYATIKTCVDAMRFGASDYITKPFDMDEIRAVVRRAVTRADEAKANAASPSKRTASPVLAQPASPEMQKVFEMVTRAATSKATVLIRGESGTGKELIARALHEQSQRAKDGGPFVAVSCAALSETLLDSELFGHEKNAFTGAAAEKKGRFELAHGGTLFLDEIGDIAPAVQIKLLRVLQQREFERVGGTKTDQSGRAPGRRHQRRPGASDQRRQVPRGPVLPPPGDPDHAAAAARARRRHPRPGGGLPTQVQCGQRTADQSVAPDAMMALTTYPWPGNVRELENVIERCVVLSDSDATDLTCDLLPSIIRSGSPF